MEYILNKTPIRTSNNFKVNDFKVDLDIKEKLLVSIKKSLWKQFQKNLKQEITWHQGFDVLVRYRNQIIDIVNERVARKGIVIDIGYVKTVNYFAIK